MSRSALSRARQFVRAVRRRASRRGLILLYHRVAESAVDPWQMCVTPAHFAEHLEVLARRTRVVPLTALPSALERAGRGETVVAITFDDGYADNLEHAKPLLERYGLPATVFVATGYVGQERYWWDELAGLILGSHPLPDRLEIAASGVEWRVDQIGADPHDREELHERLWHDLHLLSEPDRDCLLAALAAWAGLPRQAAADGARPMRAEEIGRLVEGGLIEIGAHTVTHPALPALLSEAMREELVASRLACERLVAGPVTTFAYPFGEICAETVRQVRNAGFSFACTSVQEAVREYRADHLRLPRLVVGDWSGERFVARMRSMG